MTYRTSDIARAARQIADLEGADFISWNENIRLINEAWTSMFQKLINKGDRSFVSSADLYRGYNDLPDSFHQICSVRTKDNRIVPRYTVGMGVNDLSYEVKGRQIFIRGADIAECEYYNTPLFLTYPNEPVETSISLAGTELPFMGIDRYILTVQNSSGTFVFSTYNVETGEKIGTNSLTASEGMSTGGYIDARGVFHKGRGVICPDGTVRAMTEKDGKLELSYNGDTYRLSKPTTTPNCIYSYVDGLLIFNSTVSPVAYWPVFDDTSLSQMDTYDGSLKGNSRVMGWNGHTVVLGSEYVAADGVNMYHTPTLAYTSNVNSLDGMAVNLCFLKCDTSTGYGFFNKADSKVYPITPDTVLSFPDSIYFSLLSYSLAVSYAVKQGKDAAGLDMLLQRHWETFYDTLGSDSFGQSKIINTYTYRG